MQNLFYLYGEFLSVRRNIFFINAVGVASIHNIDRCQALRTLRMATTTPYSLYFFRHLFALLAEIV